MENKIIAWIEDDYEVIGLLARLLTDNGYKIISYPSQQVVMEKMGELLASDAIILDIILPEIDDNNPYTGVKILEQLKTEHQYSGPVIVCTGVRNPAVHAELRSLGATEILQKPVRPSKLYEVVTAALENAENSVSEE